MHRRISSLAQCLVELPLEGARVDAADTWLTALAPIWPALLTAAVAVRPTRRNAPPTSVATVVETR